MSITKLPDLYPEPVRVKFAAPTNSTLHHAPSSATAAVCSLSASDLNADESWVLRSVTWSYDVAPTGSLTIACGSDTWKIDITAAGIVEYRFPSPMKFAAATAVTITLASGGTGVTGKLNARDSWIEKSQ